MDSAKYQIDYVTLSDDTIGQGAYGVVKKGYQSGKLECAVKIPHPLLVKASPKHRGLLKAMILHEADVMNKLSSHPNLVRFIGLHYPPSNEDENYPPYLVMELCHKGNLRSYLEVNKLDLKTKCGILNDIAKGLEHLHSFGYIHCDLTPNNILLTKDSRAKIGDVGATKLSLGEHLTDPAPGAVGYMGPEAKKGSNCSYNEKLDVYSFGCIVLFTLTEIECTDNIREWIERVSPWPLLQKLAKQCLDDDPQKRPSAGQISELLYSLLEPHVSDFDAKLIPFKKFCLKVVKENHLSIIDFLSSLAIDLPGLNQATFTKCINRSYVDDFLHAQLPDVTKFEPNCSGYVDLDVGAIFNPLPELMIAGNQLNSRQSQHKQIAFNGIINVSENTTHTCLYKVFDKPFTTTSVFTKFCPKNSHDDMDITVLALGLLLCCLFYSLEPLLYVQPFNDTSNKQKRQVIRPCISEGDNLPPAEKIAYVDCSTSEKSELSTSSTLQVSCHKNTSERQDERNEKKIPVNNDRRLPCCYRSLNSNPKKADIKYLRIFGFIAFLFSMFFLINSISVNGFNISKHTSSKAHINFIPVIAQNISLFKSDHCVVDEYLASALPQDLNPQCKVQHCATNNTPLYNSEICENSSSNYSTRLINEEDSIYHERHTSLVQLTHCLPDPFLCSHYTHAVCRFVNTSGVKPIKLHQNDQLVVRQDDVSSSSVVHNNYLSYMEHPRYRLVNQSTNITLSLSYNYHLPLTNNILNVAPSSSTSLLGITTVEDMQPVLLHSLATLPAALPCNSFTQSNQTLFTGKHFTDMPIKSEILIPSRITGTLELKGEQCFDKVIASSSTIHFLSNSNNTCYKFLYGALDKYTHVVINFDRLTDAILFKPLNATSIVSLQSIDNIFPLVLHNNSNVMVNVVIMIKFLNIVKSKFKSMTMQCQLQNPIPFVVLCIYICVKWIIIIALTSIKQKLLLLTQCCNLYLKKLQRPLVRASNIYCLKNPTSFCKVNQHVLFCKQQQVWFIDLTKHRHFSNAWCKKCQENLSRPCIIGFKIALNNLLGFCDIISVKSSFVLIKQITCNKASNLLVFLQLLIDGRRVHISSSIAALKNYSMPIILFGKLTKLPKVLSLTKHSSLASTVCQVDNSAQLSNILHAHYFESQWCYSNVEWTKSMIISIIYHLHPMQTIYVISGLQKTSLFLQINEVTNEATQACAMHVVYIIFNHKGQRRCNTKDHISTTNGQYRNVNNYIHNMRQLQEDNNTDSIEVIHGGLPKSDHHMHDNCHNSDQHDDDNHNINQNDQDGDHYDDQSNHTLDDNNYDHDTNNNNNDGDHAENDDDDHHDNHGNNHDDEHDDNGYDHNDDHTDNHNDDCNHDNHGDDHDDNDYDHADDDDDDHNDDDDDNHCNNDDDNNDQDHNVAKFIILAFSYCFLMLLLLLYRLFLVSCHIFVWQILRFCNWIMHLLSGRTRVARIDNQSHGYTFMPNRRHKLVHVLNTKTTAIDRSHHPYIYRDRYSQVYAKLLIYIGFQLSPLYSNEATNFQVSRFVNLITYIRNDLQFSNNSLQIFHRGDGPIMLLSSGHLMCISIYIQARQNSQLSLLPFGCHKVLVTVLTFRQVGCGRSQFNIIAMRFEDLNITEIVRWLCMNQYFLWNCNHFVSLQLFRISDELPSQKQLTLQEIDNCTPYSTKKNELQNCIYLAKISVRNLIDCLEEHLFANFYSFLRLQFTNEDLLQSIFFTNLRALYPAMIAKRHVMFLHNISQLVIGDRQKKLYLEAIQVVLERVMMPAGAIILLKPTIAYNLLDLPNDGADVVEMVTGCTLRILGESMANESGIKLVLHRVTYNICIHQLAQRKLSIDSLPDHGRDLLIKKDHVFWFLPVNPPLCHQYLLGGDSKDPDVNSPADKSDDVAVFQIIEEFFLVVGPNIAERTVFLEHEITGVPPPHQPAVQVTDQDNFKMVADTAHMQAEYNNSYAECNNSYPSTYTEDVFKVFYSSTEDDDAISEVFYGEKFEVLDLVCQNMDCFSIKTHLITRRLFSGIQRHVQLYLKTFHSYNILDITHVLGFVLDLCDN